MKICLNRNRKKEFSNVLESGWFVFGTDVQKVEEEFSAFSGAGFCAGLISGLDALSIAFQNFNFKKGDEVYKICDVMNNFVSIASR